MGKLGELDMIGSELKKGICLIAALGLAVLTNGIVPVYAEGEGTDVSVTEQTPDRTSEQYYFQKDQSGIVFPGWNQYENGKPAANVDPEKEIVVAVVGTGVDYTHEDLKNVMWDSGESVAALTKLGGGKYGFNAAGGTDKSDPMDDSGEGTRTASLIAAEWNGIGISGALSGVKIMAVKAATPASVTSGLRYVLAAKKAGVNIGAVTLSSANIRSSNLKMVSDLLTKLGEEGVITVVPAGDNGTDLDKGSAIYETLRGNPYVIVAAAAGEKDSLLDSSSYGKRIVSVLAPGKDILAADITAKTEPQEEAGGQTGGGTPAEENGGANNGQTGVQDTAETPVVSQNYTSKSGTAASAAIVTAAAAYLYDRLPDLKADERAARMIENSDLTENTAKWVSGGIVNPEKTENEKNSAPLPDRIVIDGENADIRGNDFGTSRGTVKVDGETVSSSYWSDKKITVKAEVFSTGAHTVEIIRADTGKKSEEKASFKRELLVAGDASSGELPTEGLPEKFVFDAVSVLDNKLYAAGHTADKPTKTLYYRYDDSTEPEKWVKADGTDIGEFTAADACSDGTYIYSIADDAVVLKTSAGSEGSTKQIYVPEHGENPVTNARITYLSKQLIVSATAGSRVTLAKMIQYETEYKSIPFCSIEEENVRCIDVVETGGKLLAVCVASYNSEVIGEQLVVYEIAKDPETDRYISNELFKEAGLHPDGTYTIAGAVSNGKVITVWRAEKEGVIAGEYTVTGQPVREVTVLEDAVSSLSGEIDSEGMLYLAGNKNDDDKTPFAVSLMTGEEPEPSPSPSVSPAPTSTPKPAAKPEKTTAPAPAPASAVQTCQDAGFPAGWYWNESKKACVAPAAAAPSNNGTAGNGGQKEGGTYNGTGTNTAPGTNGTNTSGTLTPDPSGSPDATETPEMTETPEPSEQPELTDPPIEIINTKGILWFLGIPVLMILCGLAVFLTKSRGLIPWIIALDAIGSVVLAIFDHSVVGWILVVLNLAAVGLLALYRSGKQDEDEEDEEFEEDE